MSSYIGDNAEIGPEATRRRRSPFEVMSGYLKSGRFIADLSEEFNLERVSLPDGYNYATASSITISEISKLWKKRRDDFAFTRSTHINYGRTIINVGVRNANQRLVGNGTLVHDNNGWAQFSDFRTPKRQRIRHRKGNNRRKTKNSRIFRH